MRHEATGDRKKVHVFGFALFGLLFALCFPAGAQQAGKVSRIGFLLPNPSSDPTTESGLEGFRKGLRDLGYNEGKNIAIEYRFAEGKLDQLPRLAEELVRLKVDVIVTGGNEAIRASKKATSTIPIVMAFSGDPVGTGFVASLARPGGNITGLTSISQELVGKRLEILKEVVPQASHVAMFWSPDNPLPASTKKEIEDAAKTLRVTYRILEVTEPNDFESAFSTIRTDGARALVVLPGGFMTTHRKRIVELAAKNRIPAVYGNRRFVGAGGRMSFGAVRLEDFPRAAYYVDRILKGAKPAELPVEQPTKFELVINLKTAKQIGLTIPPNVLVRADRVIK